MNQRSLELLRRIGERKDIMLAILLLAIVFMMVLPLPPVALDILIAINMTVSVVLLMMAPRMAPATAPPPISPRC